MHLTVCDLCRKGLWVHGQRFAPDADLRFTDEEVITRYLGGILDGKCPIKTLYAHVRRYWYDGFPHLPSYGGFVRRLNRLADGFPALLERWSSAGAPATPVGVADAFPVVLVQQSRRYAAKVAKDIFWLFDKWNKAPNSRLDRFFCLGNRPVSEASGLSTFREVLRHRQHCRRT